MQTETIFGKCILYGFPSEMEFSQVSRESETCGEKTPSQI